MGNVVSRFRRVVVEGRFAGLFVSVWVVAMRFFLFRWGEVSPPDFPDTGYVWRFLAPWFADPFVSFAASTFSVFILAGILSRLNHRFSIIRTRTGLPFTVPLFLLSVHPYFLQMVPDFVALFFLLLALFPLLSSYHHSHPQLFAFQSAVLIGLAGIFQIYALILLPLWWRGEMIVRGFKFRSFLASLIGVGLVYWSVFALFLYLGHPAEWLAPFHFLARISVEQFSGFSAGQWLMTGAVFVVLVVFLMLVRYRYARDKVLTQMLLGFLNLLIICTFILQILYMGNTFFWVSVALTLLSFLIAYYCTLAAGKGQIYVFCLVLGISLLIYLDNFFSFLPSFL